MLLVSLRIIIAYMFSSSLAWCSIDGNAFELHRWARISLTLPVVVGIRAAKLTRSGEHNLIQVSGNYLAASVTRGCSNPA